MSREQSADVLAHRSDRSMLLCIDDSAIILDILKSILERSGYSVFAAASGSQALEILADHTVDLVILDWEMPEMSGHETASEIRRMKPGMPIIINSGCSEVPHDAFQVADAFVSKGTEYKALLAAITELISSRHTKAHSREKRIGMQEPTQSN